MNTKNLLRLVVCIMFPLLIGGFSGYLTSSNIATWYVTLIKPSFNPPNYVFGPVWTILYLLMGISFFLVLKNAKPENKNKLIFIFVLQMVLNFFWSIIFFKFHQLGFALFEIVLLWISIATMIIIFYKTDKTAGLINLPYLLWVSFASVLNYSLYSLNS